MAVQSSIFQFPYSLRRPFALGPDKIAGVIRKGREVWLLTLGLDGLPVFAREMSKDFGFPIGADREWLWLAHDNRIEQRTLDGTRVIDLELESGPHKRRIGAGVIHDGGLILAIEQLEAGTEYGLSGELVRISNDRTIDWGSVLAVDRISYPGCVEPSAKNGFQNVPKPAWKPKQWITHSQAPICVSGDYVFASFQEYPRSGIGKYYVVRLTDGQPLLSTQNYPVSWTCNLSNGKILTSASGYGAYWTMRLDPTIRDGAVRDQLWPTRGRCFQSPQGELYCVEMFHDPASPAHVVRLLPDGKKESLGAPLPGYHTSAPVRLDENRFCFWRGGKVWVCDPRANRLEAVLSTGNGKLDYSEAIRIADGLVAFVVYQNAKSAASETSQLAVIRSDCP